MMEQKTSNLPRLDNWDVEFTGDNAWRSSTAAAYANN
jgi:hypothetical protein